ncbi:MAG TPA: pilus assembly protein TadG-related protein [Alphaproteobacteria bacterium]
MPRSKPTRSMRRLLRDDGGAVVLWVTVALVAFFAIGALVIDGGRLFNIHTQMQSYADHAALAAAAELDGHGDAITRAINAATGALGPGPIVTDTQNFSGDGSLAVQRLVFLSALGSGTGPAGTVPGDNVVYTYPDDGAPTIEQSRQARFVQVTVEPRSVLYALAPVMNVFGAGVASAGTAQTFAIAGFTRTACRFPPLMICNPTEDTANGTFDWESMKGKQILLKTKGGGNSAQWAPGDFGLLDLSKYATSNLCPSGGGAAAIRCLLGLRDPGTQCVEQGALVDVAPGERESVHAGLNVRFDIWDPPMGSRMSDPAFAPARNVTKGKVQSRQCTSNKLTELPPGDPADTDALPQDDCFAAGNCDFDNRVGRGVSEAALQAYWQKNHPSIPWSAVVSHFGRVPTRYEIYRYEIANEIPNKSAQGGENGNPTCAPAPVTEPADMSPVLDRRVLLVAIINCKEHGVKGSADNIPVESFAMMFLTEPVGADPSDPQISDIYAEFMDFVEANDETGILHELPILYR